MKILVTGGTGFIGTSLIPKLLKEGHSVRLLIRDLKKAEEMFANKCELVVGDIADNKSLIGICENIDVVFHMVAKVGNDLPTEKSIAEFRTVNVQGTKNIVAEAKKSKVKKFVYISSIAAMGIVKEYPITEKSKCEPYLPYQTSKYEAEQVINEEYKNNGFPGIVVRPTKVYGVGEHSYSFLTLSKLCRKHIFLKVGKGQNYISNIYISDFVQCLLKLINNGKLGETYIISSEKSISFRDVGKTIEKELGKKILVIRVNGKIMLIAARLHEKLFIKFNKRPIVTEKNIEATINDRVYDISKAKREIGYKPEVSMEKGIKTVVNWYKRQGLL